MKLSDTRNIVIAQALEESDSGNRLISDAEKRRADAAAGAPLSNDSSQAKQDKFLAKRANSVIGTIEPKLEGDRSWLRASPFRSRFSLFAIILIVAAALFGYFTNELSKQDSEMLNILQFPLIGIMVWSLVVYFFEIFVIFRKNGAASGISGIICRALFPPPIKLQKDENESSLEFRARALFMSRWRQINIPPLAARIKATLHLTALILAAAAIVGMYVKGISKEYKAGWESTFFEDGEQLEPFLKKILGPAAAILGDELPDGEHLDKLKLEKVPEPAARWIHWYAVTIGLFVLLPRLLLGFFWHFRALTDDRNLAFREISPSYFERILALATGDSLGIAIVPYAHKAGDNVVQGIRTYMEDEFKRPVSIHWEETIVFGDEDDAEVEIPANLQPMLLFNFASTPEKETHLALYSKLSGDLDEGARPYHIILDCEAFDRKADSFNDADERRLTRLNAWTNLFAAEKCEIHVISDHDIAVKEE